MNKSRKCRNCMKASTKDVDRKIKSVWIKTGHPRRNAAVDLCRKCRKEIVAELGAVRQGAA